MNDLGPPPTALPPATTSKYDVRSVGTAVGLAGLKLTRPGGHRPPSSRAVEESPAVQAARQAAATGPLWGTGDLETPPVLREAAPAPRVGKALTFGRLTDLVRERQAGRRAVVENGDVDGVEPAYFEPTELLKQPGVRTAATVAAQALARMQRGSNAGPP